MLHRDQPANEPYESELGSVVRSWADAQTGAIALELQSPLDAPGMDSTP